MLTSASPAPSFADLDDQRVVRVSPIASPALLLQELSASDAVRKTVQRARQEVDAILKGEDDRLLCVVGPCSVHDVEACHKYARKLAVVAKELEADLKIVMRVYFEKPRTTVGWKGLINDPNLDGSNDINKGLKIAREFLLEVNKLGLGAGVEYLDAITPQYFSDLVVWGAIGARTTESQVHRQLASGLSCAIGFKNGTSGDIQVAIDACLSSMESHSFLSVTKDGVVAIVHTSGNPMYHVILRGGSTSPNFDAASVEATRKAMKAKKLDPRIVVDCSHANTLNADKKKDYKLQGAVCAAVGEQIAAGERDVRGIMIESHLCDGSQSLVPGSTDLTKLKRGISVTDGCINFEDTAQVLRKLAGSVRERRKAVAGEKRIRDDAQ